MSSDTTIMLDGYVVDGPAVSHSVASRLSSTFLEVVEEKFLDGVRKRTCFWILGSNLLRSIVDERRLADRKWLVTGI